MNVEDNQQMTGNLIKLIEWLAQNVWSESVFLGPFPSTNIEIENLLDKISELWKIDKTDIAYIYNNSADKRQDQEENETNPSG